MSEDNNNDEFDWGDDDLSPESDVSSVAIDEGPPANGETEAGTDSVPSGETTRPTGKAQKIGELTFDLETVPDQARMEIFEEFLGELPARYASRSFDEIDDDLGDILSGNVPDVEAWLKAVCPAPEVVSLMRGIETEQQKKPRKGVVDALDSILEAVDAYDQAVADRVKLLSVTPEFCSIAAMGFAIDNADPVALIATDEEEERDILRVFWEMARRSQTICGFNIVGFDLQVIVTRSIILGVPASTQFDLRWGKGLSDIYLQRFGGRGKTGKGPGRLKDLAKMYGVEVPAGDFHGGQVAEAMETEEGRDLVREYVCSDVEVTRELRQLWLGYFC